MLPIESPLMVSCSKRSMNSFPEAGRHRGMIRRGERPRSALSAFSACSVAGRSFFFWSRDFCETALPFVIVGGVKFRFILVFGLVIGHKALGPGVVALSVEKIRDRFITVGIGAGELGRVGGKLDAHDRLGESHLPGLFYRDTPVLSPLHPG